MSKYTNKKNTKSKKNEKSNNVPDYVRKVIDEFDEFAIVGKITKIFYESDKCITFGFECYNVTTNGNVGKAWVTCVTFDTDVELEEDDYYLITGYISSSEYKGEWSNRIVARTIAPIEE